MKAPCKKCGMIQEIDFFPSKPGVLIEVDEHCELTITGIICPQCEEDLNSEMKIIWCKDCMVIFFQGKISIPYYYGYT